ncbi:MAG: hypothetical protein R3B47_00540 [Bacteroidia bacterium]
MALWLIGSGIKMIWNRPFSPKDNAKVERNQDTTWRWSEIAKAQSYAQAQQKPSMRQSVFSASNIQSQDLTERRVPRPIQHSVKKPVNGEIRVWLTRTKNVYQFLAQKVFTRKVSQAGQINLFGRKCTIESKCKGQYVQLNGPSKKGVDHLRPTRSKNQGAANSIFFNGRISSTSPFSSNPWNFLSFLLLNFMSHDKFSKPGTRRGKSV